MKKLIIVSLILFPSLSKVNAQDSTYNIGSYSDEGVKAPNVHHLGDAWLNFLVKADTDFDYNITQATFSPNSTLDWHKHSTAQVIIVVEGEGYYQERGKDPTIIKKGDVIKCEKNVEHWHTSSIENKVSYIAIYGKEPTIWTDKVTQQYYNKVAEKLKEK